MRPGARTIKIVFIGGPKDGGVMSIEEPFIANIKIQSEVYSDRASLYTFDYSKDNHTEPFKYRFKEYVSIKCCNFVNNNLYINRR